MFVLKIFKLLVILFLILVILFVLYGLKNLTTFWNGYLSVKREEEAGNINRQILLRNQKFICGNLMKLISLGSLNLSLVVEDSVWFLLRAMLDYSVLHAGNLYMSLPKFANTFENSIYHWKGLTLAHQDVFDEFFNSFTYQNRKVRGSKGIRKIWLEIYLQIKQTQNKARVNARGVAQSRVHFKKIFEL